MSAATRIRRLPPVRRPTVHFLRGLDGRAPVHLSGSADVTGLSDTDPVRRASVTAHVVKATADAVARRPETNAHFHAFPFPLTAHPSSVDVKVAFDVDRDGVRTVQSAVISEADSFTASEIGEWMRDTAYGLREGGAAASSPLTRVPNPVGRVLFGAATAAGLRHRNLGTVSVTSLAHRRVEAFHSDGGTTLTVGVGRAAPRPVVSGEGVAARTTVPLSLTFDHRAVDGALAADVLTGIIERLEGATSAGPAVDDDRRTGG